MSHEKALAVAEAAPNDTTAVNFAGHWQNQMGSSMDLTVAGSDVTGFYTSKTSAGGGSTTKGPIKGTVSGDLIAFSVLWPGGSITSWVGQLTNMPKAGPEVLRTLWNLVTEIPDEKEEEFLWMSTFTGADEFTR